MDESYYSDLVKRATKGERSAIDELFSIGETNLEGGDLRLAATAFKDAAISFRIQSFRNSALAEKNLANAHSLSRDKRVIVRWIKNHSKDYPKAYPANVKIDEKLLFDIVQQLLNEYDYAKIHDYLYDVLTELGVEFFSPGGSPQRRIAMLTFELLSGCQDDLLGNLRVRIGIDQIAAEVENRLRR
jgi:hypothetical protein